MRQILIIAIIILSLSKIVETREQTVFHADATVIERKLLKQQFEVDDILMEHSKYSQSKANQRQFKTGNLLGYITPWNRDGYNVSLTFRHKFTHLSPVWFRLVRTGDADYQILGEHDINSEWLREIQSTSNGPLIVPRFRLEGIGPSELISVSRGNPNLKSEANALTKTVWRIIEKYKLDGIVFEADIPHVFTDILETLATKLHENGKIIILVIPPLQNGGGRLIGYPTEMFHRSKKFIDGFSLNLYDYSSPNNPGPNSPLSWIEQEVDRLLPSMHDSFKLFVGLNFYGYNYNLDKKDANAVIGRDFLEIIRTKRAQLKWDEEVSEHYFKYVANDGSKHEIYYPTLLSIDARIQLAEDLHTSLCIWELGQGLEYFVSIVYNEYFENSYHVT